MSSMSFKDYSPDPMYYIPDHFEDDPDVQWLEYCRAASQVNRQHVLDVVLSDLDCEDSPIYDLIDTALEEPFVPGERPRENIVQLAKLGQAILNLVAKAVDDQVNLRMHAEVGR